ncbi:VOC family protein [Halobacillus sp. Marseille-Q1614]|uniref:VOC family protein n=1 Tax=Halobacillus sp. Marseille-Q1614 TaxID=2709134 RepID=UPI00156DA9FB|nr:VOC family protein [Halobacillus sp. Marseille-Q1614]
MEKQFFQAPTTFVGHVELKVQDLSRSLTFYKEVIGFQVIQQSERKAVLSSDGKTALLTIVQPVRIKPKQDRTTGLYHFAILLPDRFELAKILKHLIQLNIRLGSSDHLVSEALYLEDPDGNGIEVYADRRSSEWNWIKSEVKMAVDPLNTKELLSLAGDTAWEGLPETTVIGHIHLHVSEFTDTEGFYRALGFQVVSRLGDQALFISTGNYHHHIGLNTWAGKGAPAPSEDSAGLKSFSLVFPDEKARNTAMKQLYDLGYQAEEEDGGFLINDPSGNSITLML